MMFGFKKKQKSDQVDVQRQSSTNVISKKIHVSGYIFRDNEKLIFENRVLSPRGEGWLLITNIGMLFVLDSEGIYMNLKHEMIESFVVKNNNKVSVSWNEEASSFDYPFRIKDGKQEAKRIVNLVNETFHYKGSSTQQIELSESEIEDTKKDYITQFQKIMELNQQKIAELEPKFDEIKNEDPDRPQNKLDLITEINKSKENIRTCQKNIECVDSMYVTRSYKIPESIQNGNVWNDCYYDGSRKVFVTFAKHFETSKNAKTREIQIQFDTEMGSNAGIIIPEEKITFRFGYPVIASVNQDGRHVWHILCTLTDNMLTDEIIIARLKPKSDDESVIYETVSESWIDGKFHVCEKEYDAGHKNNVWWMSISLQEKIEWQKQVDATLSIN